MLCVSQNDLGGPDQQRQKPTQGCPRHSVYVWPSICCASRHTSQTACLRLPRKANIHAHLPPTISPHFALAFRLALRSAALRLPGRQTAIRGLGLCARKVRPPTPHRDPAPLPQTLPAAQDAMYMSQCSGSALERQCTTLLSIKALVQQPRTFSRKARAQLSQHSQGPARSGGRARWRFYQSPRQHTMPADAISPIL